MKTHSLFLAAALLLVPKAYAQTSVFINELMPSNVNGIMDDRYEFPDSWVELFNPSSSEIDIRGWYLSNSKKNLTKWKVPVSCVIPPKGYKLIYLDTENTGLHANFRLDVKGEELYLVASDGETIVDVSKKFDKQVPADNSFGRLKDGGVNGDGFCRLHLGHLIMVLNQLRRIKLSRQ